MNVIGDPLPTIDLILYRNSMSHCGYATLFHTVKILKESDSRYFLMTVASLTVR